MALPAAWRYRTKHEKTEACSAALQHLRAGWWPAVGVGEQKRSRGYLCHQDTRKGFYFMFPLKMAATSYQPQLGWGQLLKYRSGSPARGLAGPGQWGAVEVPLGGAQTEGEQGTKAVVKWVGFCSLGLSREGKVQIVEGGREDCKTTKLLMGLGFWHSKKWLS